MNMLCMTDIEIRSVYMVSFFFFSWPHSVACRILVPQPGNKPRPLTEHRFLTTEPPGNSTYDLFLRDICFNKIVNINMCYIFGE